MESNLRYDGKPLTRLLELYVLWAIGELPEAEKLTLDQMSPKLQAIYGGGGEWHEAVAAAVQMPTELPVAIRDMWLKNLEIAQLNSVALHPQKFAEMVVDSNFSD